MTSAQKRERSARVRRMNAILKRLYPAPKIALDYTNTWELLVAVMLSAQCTDARVNEVTKTLFKKYKTVRSFSEATQKEMEHAVYSCGFYRNKARNIRGAAATLIATYGGDVPQTMEELIVLPGVARKTANVVLSNAFNIHEGIAVDTHVRRFAIRFDLSDYRDPKRIERDLMDLMDQSEWWNFNHRLVQYGRDYCPARRHACLTHPLTMEYPDAANIWPRAH